MGITQCTRTKKVNKIKMMQASVRYRERTAVTQWKNINIHPLSKSLVPLVATVYRTRRISLDLNKTKLCQRGSVPANIEEQQRANTQPGITVPTLSSSPSQHLPFSALSELLAQALITL